MTKQEFLAFSLPYELHGMTQKRLGLINGIEYEKQLPIIWRGEKISGRCGFGIRPILRPLSDLTKEIEHNGEKFVPIVELAKIIYPKHEWKISNSGLYAVVGNGYMVFEYDYGYNCFLCDNSAQLDQLECLLKTIEWHFDIANLIPKGEAIDVNTLDINPYK